MTYNGLDVAREYQIFCEIVQVKREQLERFQPRPLDSFESIDDIHKALYDIKVMLNLL